jgi:sugar phosphate isomerase/epimerase
MKIEQVAVILYTFRDFLNTSEEVQTTLQKIADIGYRAIQVSGMRPDVMPPEDIFKRASDLGLTICATHEPPDLLFNHPDQVVERLQALHASYTAYPFPTGIDLSDTKQVESFLSDLTSATNRLSEAGITLCYHNHALEFQKMGDKTIYERIFEETPIQAEPDTYWIQAGGASPLSWVRRLKGKIPLLHMKDMRVVSNQEQQFAEIGAGNIEFQPIIEEAEAGGCRWFIVEQDKCYEKSPFESAAESFRFIREHLVDIQ